MQYNILQFDITLYNIFYFNTYLFSPQTIQEKQIGQPRIRYRSYLFTRIFMTFLFIIFVLCSTKVRITIERALNFFHKLRKCYRQWSSWCYFERNVRRFKVTHKKIHTFQRVEAETRNKFSEILIFYVGISDTKKHVRINGSSYYNYVCNAI